MALSAEVLSAAMRAAILAEPDACAVDGDALTALCDAIAGAVVEHITGAATVPAGITVQVDPNTGLGATTSVGTVA
jgi:hypothetical protein